MAGIRAVQKTPALVFFLLPFLLAAESVPGVAAKVNLKRLVNRPEMIASEVESYREEGYVWIRSDADVHVCSEKPLSVFRALLLDFNGHAGIFKRITVSQAVREGSAGVEIFMQVTVTVLGTAFVTNYNVLYMVEQDDPDCFVLRSSHLADDGTIRNVHGFWYLKTVWIDEKPYTYIRFFSSSAALKKSFLQKTAMVMFADSEYTGTLKELLNAARR